MKWLSANGTAMSDDRKTSQSYEHTNQDGGRPGGPLGDPPDVEHGDVYRLLVDSVQDYAIFALDVGGHILTWNAGARRIKGYTRDEIVGKHFSIFYPPEDVAAGKPQWELEVAAAEGRVEDENWRVRKDGSRFWANVVISALRDPRGHLLGFGKVTRDLTARRAMEEALSKSEERFRLLVQGVKDYAIFMLDTTGHIETWNEGAEKLKGYTAAEIVGKHFSIFYPQKDLDSGKPARELTIAAETGRYEEEGWRVRKDGSQFWANVLITAIHDARGQLIGFAKVTRDLTERRANEQEARDAAARLAAEEAEGRALASQADELRRLNTELEALAREERSLRDLAEAIAAATRIPDLMHQIAQGAVAMSNAAGAYVEQVVVPEKEVEVVAAAGTSTPLPGRRVAYPGSLTEEIIKRREPIFLARMEGVGTAMAPYLAEHCSGCSLLVVPLIGQKDALGALALVRSADEPPFEERIVARAKTLGNLASITLQRLAALSESERRRTEAEAAVRQRDEVMSIVSHDLRNPLTTISMSASLLRDSDIELSAGDEMKQLEVIARSAHRMNRLIQDLLDVTRMEGGRFTINRACEDLHAIVSEACEAFRPLTTDKSLALNCHVDPDVPKILVDRDRILQALSNFLTNAVKFTPTGGKITVRVDAVANGTEVQFEVSDTGPGIEADHLPHVFDRFWQAKRTAYLGSGLGLAIAKHIAEAHRGRVGVDSEVGRGSTFRLVLPVSPECR